MSVSLALLACAGVLIATGVYLMLERSLSRILLGIMLGGNGINLLFVIASGSEDEPPFHGSGNESAMADPLPFALVLTAIVITMGLGAFILALAHRNWQLFGDDEVKDDVEDRRVARREADEDLNSAEDVPVDTSEPRHEPDDGSQW